MSIEQRLTSTKSPFEKAQGWTILRIRRLSEGDVDHGLGDMGALFVVANEAFPPGHPAKRSLDHPSFGQRLEAALLVGTPDAWPSSGNS